MSIHALQLSVTSTVACMVTSRVREFVWEPSASDDNSLAVREYRKVGLSLGWQVIGSIEVALQFISLTDPPESLICMKLMRTTSSKNVTVSMSNEAITVGFPVAARALVYRILAVMAGNIGKSCCITIFIGRWFDVYSEAVVSIRDNLIAGSRGITPLRAGSSLNDSNRLIEVGAPLGKYRSSEIVVVDRFNDPDGRKEIDGDNKRTLGRPSQDQFCGE